MSRVVAITGASGTLGRRLVAELARRGDDVWALVRKPEAFAIPGVRVARCDLPDVLDASALAGADAVVHCAYGTKTTDLAEARRVNEDGTRRILDASRRAGVRRFVFVSTIAADPAAPSYYGRSKAALEALCDPTHDAIVRPGLIIARDGQGVFQSMRDAVRNTHVVPLFDGGRQLVQTVHVDDVCAAIARVLDRDLTGAFNVAEPDPMTLKPFLRLMAARLQVRCLLVPLPFRPVLAAVKAIEAIGLPFPLRSESLLGLSGLRSVPVAADLARLDLRVRSAEESLADAL